MPGHTPAQATHANYSSAGTQEPNMRFESFDFAPEILRAISDCGYQEMTPVQSQAIPAIRRMAARTEQRATPGRQPTR